MTEHEINPPLTGRLSFIFYLKLNLLIILFHSGWNEKLNHIKSDSNLNEVFSILNLIQKHETNKNKAEKDF